MSVLSVLKFLKYPMVRHLLAGACIVGLLWGFSIAPLQEENKELRGNILKIVENQHKMVKILANKDTYKIENRVEGAKIKKGGEIRLIPESDLGVVNVTTKRDSVARKERSWLWRLFH